MDILQLVLVSGGLMTLMALGYLAFAGRSPAKDTTEMSTGPNSNCAMALPRLVS